MKYRPNKVSSDTGKRNKSCRILSSWQLYRKEKYSRIHLVVIQKREIEARKAGSNTEERNAGCIIRLARVQEREIQTVL